MKWIKDTHLTDDQLRFLECAGGNIKVTSLATGTTHRFSLRPANVGRGMIVRILEGNNSRYVGWIPFKQNGTAGNSFIHTAASEFPLRHEIFQTFLWVWINRNSDTFASKCLLTNA